MGLGVSVLRNLLVRFLIPCLFPAHRICRITRVWTAQESVLAKETIVYRSCLSIRQESLNRFMDYLPAHNRNKCCEFRLEHPEHVNFRDEVFSQWRAFFGRPQSDTSILLPLEYYRMRKSGDPRDKIYGMLGIAGDIYRQRIRADYETSTEASQSICTADKGKTASV